MVSTTNYGKHVFHLLSAFRYFTSECYYKIVLPGANSPLQEVSSELPRMYSDPILTILFIMLQETGARTSSNMAAKVSGYYGFCFLHKGDTMKYNHPLVLVS